MKRLLVLSGMLLFMLVACQGASLPTLVNEKENEGELQVAVEPTSETSEGEVSASESLPQDEETQGETEVATNSGLQIGDPAPDFTLLTPDGEKVSLEDYRGKVVLLNFWATWCGPCRYETPLLQRLYEKYENEGLVVIGISIDGESTADSIPDFIKTFELTYPIVHDREGTANEDYYIEAIPQSYYVDAEGIIQDSAEGVIEWDFLEGKVLTLLDPEAGKVRMAALDLVIEGSELAEEGDIEGATAKFKEALSVDPGLSIEEPEAEARGIAAFSLLYQGEDLAIEGEIKAALTAYEEAQVVDPDLEISAGSWNNLCWFGALWNQAEMVLEACEKGVELASRSRVASNRDSRGVAKALTGDYEGAIDDFKAMVAWSKENGQYEEYGVEREAWIASLEKGENPFDEETLEALRDE